MRTDKSKYELTKDFEKLTDDLNRIAGENLYEFERKSEATYHWNITRRSENGVDYCEIIREAVFSSGSWRSHKNALKIRTSHCNIENMRLQKDFGDKNVAENLHKHCTKLLDTLEAKRSHTKEIEAA